MSGKKAKKLARKAEKARLAAGAVDWDVEDLDLEDPEPQPAPAPEPPAEPQLPAQVDKTGPDPDEARAALRSAKARLLGYAAAASLTPEQRRERASKAGKASAAKRRAERERLGLPDPSPRRAARPQPSMIELDDYVSEILKRDPSRTWSHTELRSQAITEMKLDLAREAFERAKK